MQRNPTALTYIHKSSLSPIIPGDLSVQWLLFLFVFSLTPCNILFNLLKPGSSIHTLQEFIVLGFLDQDLQQ